VNVILFCRVENAHSSRFRTSPAPSNSLSRIPDSMG
jgi:hypothetical protein